MNDQLQGFLPSRDGLSFPNDFPDQAIVTIHMPILGTIGIGNAAYGLCGGMVATTLDYWVHRATTKRPPPGDPTPELMKYLEQRQVDSLRGIRGVWQCYLWMAHGLDTDLQGWTDEEVLHLQGLCNQQNPVPLMLTRIHSLNPFDMAHNHQVLAHTVRITSLSQWVVDIYDPNHPGKDTCRLVRTAQGIFHTESDQPVRGFYVNLFPSQLPIDLEPQQQGG